MASETEEEETVIVCMACDMEGAVVRESVRRTCTECGSSVWLAPTSRALEAQPHARCICIRCSGPMFKKNPGAKLAAITPEQIREVLRAIRGRG